MEALFVHLLKSSGILLLFLLSYLILLKKETFFTGNRTFLVIGLLSSLLVPFINITKTIYVAPMPMEAPTVMAATQASKTMTKFSILEVQSHFDWTTFLSLFYVLGVVYFTFRLFIQLYAIKKIKKNSSIVADGSFYHVHTVKQISPFSFFKYIFYHPQQFDAQELKTILTHEKMHVRGLHSIDILLTELIFILLWFNPAVWFYKSVVKQNLEFIADAKTCNLNGDKKSYQYLMLKQAINTNSLTIVNAFFNSIIKKRIVMLNQNQSRRINLLKLLIVVPLVGLFIMGFNTKEVVEFTPNDTTPDPVTITDIDFVSPLRPADIKNVTSGFGMAKDPISNKVVRHSGIDLVARSGTKVSASAAGIVQVAAFDNLNGNYVVVRHDDVYSTRYIHLKDKTVAKGAKVKAGEVIGHVGSTGRSTGPHLHFEILKSGNAINPESMVLFNTPKQKKVIAKPTSNKSKAAAKSIELLINKNSSNDDLEKMKSDLAKNGIDFSYSLVHNEAHEIVEIKVNVTGTGENGEQFNSSYSSSDNENGISPLVIYIDLENNLVSIGSKGAYQSNSTKVRTNSSTIHIDTDTKHKEIVVRKEDGVKKVYVDGEEIDKDDIHEHDVDIFMNDDHDDEDYQIHISSDDHSKTVERKFDGGHVTVVKSGNKDNDITITNNDGGFFFVNTKGKKKPLYYIDGEPASEKDVKKLSPNDVQSVNVYKGKQTISKYGKKAKNGVVEITTKQ
ncbi:peptidoglycan DD-metalloendopeptidase family protein [uncultured Croceitalea sp.]|uniref:peptidoglycan DD-metalloendopeptidase family protein n=1 Tax=uncultured Croceitalea sp. TaxID=1798908 RepID=UPI003305C428